MAAFLLVVLLAGTVAAESYVRYPRATTGQAGGSMAGSGSGAVSSASSFSSSSSSGTKVAPGPGGSGNFNAFAGMSNFGAPYPQDSNPLNRGGGAGSGSQFGQSSFSASGFLGSQGFSGSGFPGSQGFSGSGFPGSQGFSGSGFPGSQGFSGSGFPGSQGFSGSQSFSGGGAASGGQFGQSSFSGSQGFPGSQGFSGSQGFPGSQGAGFPGSQGAGFPGFPGYSPYVPQYGQQYPYVPFPNFAAPFDFMAFLNQYFQSLQNFQAQAEAQAQQAAAGGGLPVETNEVGGVGGLATATYSPQGGYGNANIFPKPEGALDNRFGGDDETPQNSIGGGPVSSVSGSFKPPGGSSYGVFTSSASGSSDINGKKTSFKQSTIGVNDNGKVTTYTAHDP